MSAALVAGLPSWVVVPDRVDEDPPACRPEQMRLDECLEALHTALAQQKTDDADGDADTDDADEAAFLQELQAEDEEEAAFLDGLDDDESSDPPSPPESDSEDPEPAQQPQLRNEPRGQVVYEHLGSVRTVAALFSGGFDAAERRV
ncbi:hypothetical protein DIPPA_30359 [Diplonema papillatum]|nr:hypothetical protein DIPPA_30359 [Diplonema papillatum]